MFERYRERNESALVPFIMAGDPSIEASERLAVALIEEGAAALELGVPFSDALADGPVIQQAGQRALRHNVTLEDVLKLASRLSRRYPQVPLILFSYLNPILQLGLSEYTRQAKEAGVTATLTVDLPPEEADEYCRQHEIQGLKTVFLVSPTTSKERIATIARASTGFIYVVSRTGVTGVHSSLSESLAEEIKRIRSVTDKPLAVGFGISTGEQARQVAALSEGVVVGSAFVKLISEPRSLEEIELSVRRLARDLTAGIRAK